MLSRSEAFVDPQESSNITDALQNNSAHLHTNKIRKSLSLVSLRGTQTMNCGPGGTPRRGIGCDKSRSFELQ